MSIQTQIQTQTQAFKLRDLVEIEVVGNELRAKKTKIAEVLEDMYNYFKVEIDESKYTLTIVISDAGESLTIMINKMMYDQAFVIDCFYKVYPFYHTVPLNELKDLNVARIENGILSVSYEALFVIFLK